MNADRLWAKAERGVLTMPPTELRNPLEAVRLLKDWSIWLVGIQTLAIGIIGTLMDKAPRRTEAGGTIMRLLGTFAVVCFAISIIATTFLLVALPAFYLRLPPLAPGQDILLQPAFTAPWQWVGQWTLLRLVGWEQHPFLVGMGSFAAFIFCRIWFAPKPQ